MITVAANIACYYNMERMRDEQGINCRLVVIHHRRFYSMKIERKSGTIKMLLILLKFDAIIA
uniref:Uncharacterized protein n=1 Tax=Onchocerca volvulus TaxID=6282 RepID=A0A8R1TLU9_ONCVO